MKASIFFVSALTTNALAWPNPQLLDVNLGLGGKVTVTATVTVTKPASTCLPAGSSLKTSTTKWVPAPQTTPKATSTSQASLKPLPQTTSKPVASAQSSSKPQSTPSTTTVKPTTTTPSNGGRVTGTAQAFLSVGASYQAAILYHHNAARANHGAPPLTWDTSCEANARLAANTCNYAPFFPVGVKQGQNLYITAGDAFNVTAAITEVWYKKEFPAVPWSGLASLSISLLPGAAELTQVLWKGTAKVGCASVDCGTKMKIGGVASSSNKYTVCNYAPAVSIGGSVAINLGRPLSTTNLGKWTD
ncbi:SCP-like extracellular protein [Stagonosporopsis vannaccii]|nr:SCP-like extracellular protein [Stagonosporopsis vannaccii]